MTKWKLYVWDEVLTDWTSGIAVAAARSEEEARKAVLDKYEQDNKASEWLAKDMGFLKSPKVFDLPAAAYCMGGS